MKLPFGNKPLMIVLIVLFILLWCFVIFRPAHAADRSFEFGMGTSLSHGAGQAIDAEADYRFGLGFASKDDVQGWVGTTLLGYQQGNPNNWAWHAGIEGVRGAFHVGLGAAYLQRTDGLNGSNTNYTLTVAWVHQRCWMFASCELRYRHFSNAGTTDINQGRDVLLLMAQIR